MIEITENQQQQIKHFKNIVSIIENNNYQAIAESGFIKKDEVNPDDLNDSVYEALLDKLMMASQTNRTPVDIDNEILTRDNNSFAIATMENENKTYTMFLIYGSEDLKGYVVVSDHGDLITYALSDEGVILDFKKDTITSNSLFKQIEEHAMENFEYEDNQILENRVTAALHYFDIANEGDFITRDQYLSYKVEHLVDAMYYELADENTDEFENYNEELSSDDIAKNSAHSSYIILHRALLIATAENVFIIDYEENTLNAVEHGEEFEFRGTTYTAHPQILKVVDSLLYGDEKFEHFHLPDSLTPEIKKTRTLKPGM